MPKDNLSNINKFGFRETLFFVLALISGTVYTIYSKIVLMQPNGLEDAIPIGTGDVPDSPTTFQKPLLLIFGMFVGMVFGLILHWLVLLFYLPFPGYDFKETVRRSDYVAFLPDLSSENNADNMKSTENTLSIRMYFYPIIPTVFDLSATLLCMIGLVNVDVSTFQLLRGSGIMFIALFKHYILKDRLLQFHWIGVMWNMISVVMVGLAAFYTSSIKSQHEAYENVTTGQTLCGMLFIISGTFFFAVQFVVEEKLLKTNNMPVPLLVGMEGLWGMLLSIVVVFPIGYCIPGNDNGSFEDPFHTWSTLVNSSNIQEVFVIYCFSAFLFNVFSSILVFILSSVWCGILDNFRSICVWVTELVIFYCINPSFGERWTRYSYLQIVGTAALIYGTAIYNAPNYGSIKLKGQWWALRFDFTKEYEMIRREQKEMLNDLVCPILSEE